MPTSISNKPTICVTIGDPSGIGAEVIAKALSQEPIEKLAHFIIIGDSFIFKNAYILTRAEFEYKIIESPDEIEFDGYDIVLLDLHNVDSENFEYGCIKAEYGKAAIDYIDKAYRLIKEKKAAAIVTAPINKYSCQKGGFKYQGHTEYLAHLAKASNIAMMLTGGPLSVALVTTHLPLKKVPASINRNNIYNAIALVDKWMRVYFGVTACNIAVCALNPHAGEEGKMGSEEKAIIIPAVKLAKSKGINACGPYPADSLFHKAYNNEYDVVLCMYHDQGLIPLKMVAKDEAVNITLGLPFVRTSPAHGTAFDIAGKNMANAQSFSAAIKTAVSMLIYKSKKK